jgi:TIR domain
VRSSHRGRQYFADSADVRKRSNAQPENAMPGIFISYRRSDTLPWAGRLFDGLTRSFGKGWVFMDINGGIPRGANFERVLTEALTSCDALLALIGPAWMDCKRTDGTRRLAVPGDWVRNEIATCLRRGVPVVPVLLGGTSLPDEQALPEDLRPLSKRQKADIADTDWHHHVGLLIRDLVRLTHLELVHPPEEDDVECVNTGIRLLSNLVAGNRSVADAVARSREVIENTYRQMGRLELFKSIHDSLHTIEFECLRPLQVAPASGVRQYRIRFVNAANRIRECLGLGDINAVLRDELVDALAATETAFQTAVSSPGSTSTSQLLGELNTLVSGPPSRLDAGISDAAHELSLDRLVTLMGTVRDMLGTSAADATLTRFVQGIEALHRLRGELGQRVQEHGQLQRLDYKLRTVCVGGAAAGALPREWERIKLVRARLTACVSAELQAANEDLIALEVGIDSALEKGEGEVFDLVSDYFRAVGSVFRDVDRSLKDFCLRLGAVSQPLKAVLDVC